MLDKLKQLTKDTAIYGVSTIIGRFLNFLLVPFYTHVFMPAEYGIVANIYAFIGLFNIVYLYGMDAAFMKYASFKDIGSDEENFSTPFISVFLSSFILSMFIIVLQDPLFRFLGVPGEFYYLIYFAASILLIDSIAAIPFIKLRLERNAKKFAGFKLLNIILNVILNLVLILEFNLGIESVFISNLAASLLSLILLIPDIKKFLQLKIHAELFKKLLKFGLPYLPAGLGSMIIQVIDRPILEHLTDMRTVGIYQANHKLGIFMMLFVNMFQFAWQPFFLQQAKEKDAKQVFSKVLTYFTLAGSIILIFLSLFIDDLVRIQIFGRTIIGSAYWAGLYVVPVVLFGYLFNGLYLIFTAGIFIKEKTYYVPFITGFGALICILANVLLIPILGIMGPALAALASYFAMSVSLYIVSQKVYKIDYENSKVLKLFVVVILIAAAYYWLYFQGSLSLIYKLALLAAFLIMVAVLVIDKHEMNFIRNKLSFSRK